MSKYKVKQLVDHIDFYHIIKNNKIIFIQYILIRVIQKSAIRIYLHYMASQKSNRNVILHRVLRFKTFCICWTVLFEIES